MKRKVFITGISSEIMQHFVALMDANEVDVVGLSRSRKNTVPFVNTIEGDLLEPASYSAFVKGCDTIIHAAAITHSFSKDQYFKVNHEATKTLVDLAKANKVKSFIFISSNTAGRQSGAYGFSKLQAEDYVKEQLDSWVIFRPSEIFGGTKAEGIEKLINDILTKSTVLCPQGVPTDFYPIHLQDAVDAMFKASSDPTAINTTQVIGGSKGYSFIELIELIKSVSGKNPKVIFLKKSWMFFIRRIINLLPFSLGFAPDQVERLYASKEVRSRVKINEQIKLEDYIKSKIP